MMSSLVCQENIQSPYYCGQGWLHTARLTTRLQGSRYFVTKSITKQHKSSGEPHTFAAITRNHCIAQHAGSTSGRTCPNAEQQSISANVIHTRPPPLPPDSSSPLSHTTILTTTRIFYNALTTLLLLCWLQHPAKVGEASCRPSGYAMCGGGTPQGSSHPATAQ